MNLLSQSAWLEAAFNWTWRASVASAILVLLVWLIDYSTRKHLPARASYLLWLCVFARLLLPTSPASNFSVWGLIPQIAQKDQIAHHSISTEKSLVPARTESPQISSTPKNNNTEISKTMVVKTSANVEAQISILLKWFWLAGVLANLTIIYVQHFKWLRYL
ncbi:MAG TPA: M56 family metallopeptidase, partial [Verrucomicrobiae bacterium]